MRYYTGMRTFEKREDPIRLMRRRLVILVLLALVFVGVRGVWGVYKKEQESRMLRAETEMQLAKLKVREADLRRDMASLKSERGIEEVLREEYELAKEGEGVIVIVDPTEPVPKEPEPTRMQRIGSWFGW